MTNVFEYNTKKHYETDDAEFVGQRQWGRKTNHIIESVVSILSIYDWLFQSYMAVRLTHQITWKGFFQRQHATQERPSSTVTGDATKHSEKCWYWCVIHVVKTIQNRSFKVSSCIFSSNWRNDGKKSNHKLLETTDHSHICKMLFLLSSVSQHCCHSAYKSGK